MPVCTDESVGRVCGSGASTPPSPNSPTSCSPPPPPRFLSRKSSSTFTLLDRRYLTPSPSPEPELLSSFIGWYPAFFLRFIRNLIATALYLIWNQLFLMGPAIWLSLWLWLFWKFMSSPVYIIKSILTIIFTPTSELMRKKKTIMISGGSSIQCLHLARNFYCAGARVVVVEIEGTFGLGRFSTAVDKFYNVPRPHSDRAEEYIEALKDIVIKEKVTCYLPTCVTTTAYYDALAKPHLELLGVYVFSPGLKEVCQLDDVMELLRRCHIEGMSTPEHFPIMSKEELHRLYENGSIKSGRYIMVSAGPIGCRDRMKVLLPPVKRDFKGPHHISMHRPWVIVKDYSGDHFMTCTTVKESKVVANVTCKVEGSQSKLTPVEHKEIDLWINQIFMKMKFLRPVSGHMSFRFVECTNSGSVVPLGCRVGVSLPYLCHTSVHARLVWKSCPHFSPSASGPLVSTGGRYWIHEAIIGILRQPSLGKVSELVRMIIDRREAIFSFWDPLPYLAYYHIQLPFSRIYKIISRVSDLRQ